MENYIKIYIKYLGGIIMGVISYCFGGFDLLLETLIFIFILDILTGVINSFYNYSFDSSIMRKGLIKKIYELILICLCYRVGLLNNVGDLLRNCVIFTAIINESLSILENIGKFIELPEVIKKYFKQLQNDDYLKKVEDLIKRDN